MNKQELIKDIRECIGGGGMITKNQLARYLQKTRNNREDPESDIRQYIEGLPYIPDGRGKKYFLPDIAARILEKAVKQ